MASLGLYPPIVDSYMPAFQVSDDSCKVYFRLSKFNANKDFTSVHVTVIKQDTGMSVVAKEDSNNRYRKTGIILNIKPIQVEGDLYYIEINNSDLSSVYKTTQINSTTGLVEEINKQGWVPGWIYKIQLRLSQEDYNPSDGSGQADWLNGKASSFSEWSTVCTVKAIGKINYTIPKLSISTGEQNKYKDNIIEDVREYENTTLDLTGSFEREDKSELIYSYYFKLKNEEGSIIEDSGNLYCDQYQNVDTFRYLFKYELKDSKTYILVFGYETINKYIHEDEYSFICHNYRTNTPDCVLITAESNISGTFINPPDHEHEEGSDENDSPSYEDTIITDIDSDYNNNISAICREEEDGRIGIKFYSKNHDLRSCNLCIRRTDSRTNFTEWTDIYIYVCNRKDVNDIPIFYDYTAESGVLYEYGVQTIEIVDGEEISRSALEITEQKVIREFEYSFLLGQDNKQLRFKFDNEMNNFKYQIYDSKVDPLGSKYPIISRNGNTYYRTFPITGIISFNMDENGLFTDKEEIFKYANVVEEYGKYRYGDDIYNKYYINEKHFSDKYDYTYEREFRKKVLEFLQNGEVKLFKSPTEGNILVRLTDISCTPNQTLGRLVYNFSATAHEINEANISNYIKYNLLEVGEGAEEFILKKTKLGQISTDIIIPKAGDNDSNSNNITKLIKQKYDTTGQNIAGESTTLTGYHHIKVTFDDKSLKIKIPDSTNYALGHIMNFKGQSIMVLDPVNIYEFDHRITCGMNDNFIIEGDADGKVDTVHVTIDFLYDVVIKPYEGKKIKSKKIVKGLGQYCQNCSPQENIMVEIYLKYYVETKNTYNRLNSFQSIDIEADPGATFYIKDEKDSDEYETHIVGITGRLDLIELSNIQGLYYLGMYNPETKLIEERNTDVLMNYIYLVEKGEYKE